MKRAFRTVYLMMTWAMLAPQAGLACSVCSVTNEKARMAYYFTTGFLTFLPLIMIGGIVYYIAKKGR